ncbi:hypothetical protein [Rhizobium mongolense]|uniref:Transposase n=2 Tax=Rhizobium mongolense TaxID=57676 RepID=A0ABR6IJB2_9HYPH|nr:hypothetical protein [Rhizobium mongolense]MBB4227966.1 hypothetical protein [Rhizobium mongolense]TVZ64880.1 hypothetical protein BCL32_5153 [Rhizobium mongolense USDA 1844]
MNRTEITDAQWQRLVEQFGPELLHEHEELIPVLLRYIEADR